jgi:predicted Rossmann fold nucleotide-binding protein DprA/Smf involved in DNA uptake
MIKDAAYWIAFAHLPGWGNIKRNALISKFNEEHKITIEQFFQLSADEWKNGYLLDDKQVSDLHRAKADIANTELLAEAYFKKGFDLIPVISPEFPKILKENLAPANCPSLLYTKGNKNLLEQRSVLITGSIESSDTSIQFADTIAKLAVTESKTIINGASKGVDRRALDSALAAKGKVIVVLAQGIMTFDTGSKKYRSALDSDDMLILSIFHPILPWRSELTMARNPIMCGLAEEVYVAESYEGKWAWTEIVEGLQNGKKIFARNPVTGEINSNAILIEKGAIQVDLNGSHSKAAD